MYLKFQKKKIFNLDYCPPANIQIPSKGRIKTFSAIQDFKALHPCTLSYKNLVLEVVLQEDKLVNKNKNKKLRYPGNKDDPGQQLCTRSREQP